MSTRAQSAKPFFTWIEVLIIISGLGMMLVIGGVGAAGMTTLAQSFSGTAVKSFWFISRTSGVVAYLLLTFAILWGLVQSGAILRSVISPLLALGLHNFLSWAALVMVALHALVLLGDSYIKMGPVDLFIPFIAPYQPFWVGLGIIASYLALLLSLSFYVRSHIGQKTFRAFHYLSYVTYLLVTLHGLGSGSDNRYLMAVYALSAGAVINLTFWRVARAWLAQK